MQDNTNTSQQETTLYNIVDRAQVGIKISAREQEVLRLISYEYTCKEIASILFLSTHTIDSHKKNLKIKLDVKNTAGLVRRGFELGILQIINAA